MLGQKGMQDGVKVKLVEFGKDLKARRLNAHTGADALGGLAVAHHVAGQNMIKLHLLAGKVLAQQTGLQVTFFR